jgi:hypothetical protein
MRPTRDGADTVVRRNITDGGEHWATDLKMRVSLFYILKDARGPIFLAYLQRLADKRTPSSLLKPECYRSRKLR